MLILLTIFSDIGLAIDTHYDAVEMSSYRCPVHYMVEMYPTLISVMLFSKTVIILFLFDAILTHHVHAFLFAVRQMLPSR